MEHAVLQRYIGCENGKTRFSLAAESGFFSALAGIYESPRKLVNKSAMGELYVSGDYCQ
ncbi:MAG TPA: hypothetical protein VF296_07260 [Gallionella sp.]